MRIKDMTLEQWQEKVNEYKRQNVRESGPCAMRCDGTQFSVGAMYGGFTYNGSTYTCFYFPKEGNAVIGVRDDFLKWVNKELRKENGKGEMKVNNILYHVTKKENVALILEKGLIPRGSFVSLSQCPDSWYQEGMALLEVNVDNLDVPIHTFLPDIDEITVWGKIDPSRIRELK